MYDIAQVRSDYPQVDWSVGDLDDGDIVELIGKVGVKGHVVHAPKGLVESEGLKRCADAVCLGLRHKGLLPPTDSEIAIRDYLAAKAER